MNIKKTKQNTCSNTHTYAFECIISSAILYLVLDNSVTETFQNFNIS